MRSRVCALAAASIVGSTLAWTGPALALDGRCASYSLWETVLKALPFAAYMGVLGAIAGAMAWMLATVLVRLIKRRPWRKAPSHWVRVASVCGLVCFLLSGFYISALIGACF